MQVTTLLERASKCKTQTDANQLLQMLMDRFGGASPLSHLRTLNPDAYMEEDSPCVSFELNHEISQHYATVIRPEIRGGKFSVTVQVIHFRDALGVGSRSWETLTDLDETIESDAIQTLASMTLKAKKMAISHHTQLIQRAGVVHSVALSQAKKHWQGVGQ